MVPKSVAADLRVGVDKDGNPFLEPIDKAEIYLVTKHLEEPIRPRPANWWSAPNSRCAYFNGDYKMYDDGRRSGTLTIKVADDGVVSGHYFSDKDGQKYDVAGMVSANPKHQIEFLITYPHLTKLSPATSSPAMAEQ